MLTADLVRARVAAGVVVPRYLDADDPRALAAAESLCLLFQSHEGDAVGSFDEALADHIGDSTDFLLIRGLARLLMDKALIAPRSEADPEAVREVVFRLASEQWPVGSGEGGTASRETIVAAAAVALGISVEAVEAGLFADLEAEQRLVEVPRVAPRALLTRYNLSLAQAVLLKARSVRVSLPGLNAKRARQLFRFIKFRRLMHRARRTKKGYELVLDGPLSLFRQTGRYGLALALFLPGLCLCPKWALEADVVWGKERRALLFKVDHTAGLESPTKDTGTWEGDEERHFRKQLKKLKTPWSLKRGARILDLDGRGVLVPDYVLTHPDGREAYVELVWFWRKAQFQKRLEILRDAGPANLIVCLATRLNADEKTPDVGDAAVVPFKGVIPAKRVVAAAEAVARPR